MAPMPFLLINLALAFYNVGAIWATEVDIFRSWQYVGVREFHALQAAHWRKLPYWIFLPVALALVGSIALVFYHPAGSPAWAIWGNLLCQLASHGGTALMWGRWQAKLSQDPSGPDSVHLSRILQTHWVRTLLITAYGIIMLVWAMVVAC
jgi:hypothetical protein